MICSAAPLCSYGSLGVNGTTETFLPTNWLLKSPFSGQKTSEEIYWREISCGAGRGRRGDLIYNSQLACSAHLMVSHSQLWRQATRRGLLGLIRLALLSGWRARQGTSQGCLIKLSGHQCFINMPPTVPLLTRRFTGLLVKASPTKKDVSIPNR